MTMIKLPPIEKIPEAYSAIEDDRIIIFDDYANVKSSNNEKEYTIKWKGDVYYSNDNSTYWQGYPGYPLIAVLMLQNRLSLNRDISNFFKNIDWHELNSKNKGDYRASLEYVLKDISADDKRKIYEEIDRVYEEIKGLHIELTKKKI